MTMEAMVPLLFVSHGIAPVLMTNTLVQVEAMAPL